MRFCERHLELIGTKPVPTYSSSLARKRQCFSAWKLEELNPKENFRKDVLLMRAAAAFPGVNQPHGTPARNFEEIIAPPDAAARIAR
jgi:hypothetical protein